ncbi:MAG: hypothetical protein HQL03_12390 [Nitrospirae bacterium]|nr:hypothetical protein [Nitrospirota bacterium]
MSSLLEKKQEMLDGIANMLRKKDVNKPCPRCGSNEFTVIDKGFITLQGNFDTVRLNGPYISTAIIACNHCGHITQHALGPLGLEESKR